MSEKIKVRFTVPETMAESANRFLKSLAYPTQKPDGELSPPIPISVERESGGDLGGYVVESLVFRPLGIDSAGDPRAMAVEVLALPIKNKFVYTGPRPAPSIDRYPRELVCEGCGKVVAFGPSALQDDSPIIASKLIRPNGKQPRDNDPLCLNCGESSMGIFRLTGGGPFTVRDRTRKCLHCGGSGVGLADSGDVNAPPCPCCNGTGTVDAGGFHTVQTCPTCKGTGADDGHVDDGAPNPPPCPTRHGTGKDLDNFDTSRCPTCWGSGTDAPAKDRPCPDCNGRGRQPAKADRDAMVPPCPTCNGTGKV